MTDFFEMINGDVEVSEALAYLRVACEAIHTGDPSYDVWGPYAGHEGHVKMREDQIFEPKNWNEGERTGFLIGVASNTEELARIYGEYHPARANAAFIMLARTWLPKLVELILQETPDAEQPSV